MSMLTNSRRKFQVAPSPCRPWSVPRYERRSAAGPAPLELPETQTTDVLKLIDGLEQDDDVQKVFHNLA